METHGFSAAGATPTSSTAEVGRRARVHGIVAVGVVVALCAMALAGWALGIRGLHSPPPVHQAMTPVSIYVLLLLGTAFLAPPLVAALLAGTVLVLVGWAGGAVLHLWGGFPPGHLLFYGAVTHGHGELSTVPSVQFLVAAGVVAVTVLVGVAGAMRAALAGAVVSSLLCGTLLLGIITSVNPLYIGSGGLPERGLSTSSALGLAVLASVLLARSLPPEPRRLLYGSGGFPRIFRGVLVAAVAVPVLLWVLVNTAASHLLAGDRFGVMLIGEVLTVGVVAAVLLVRLEGAQRVQNETLRESAQRDDLTGLFNRRGLYASGGRLVELRAPAEGVAALLIDIDGLKEVNDRIGHAAGDSVIRVTGARLLGAIRPGDVAARLGGDEFVVVAPVAGALEAETLAERIATHLQGPVAGIPEPLALHASIGVAQAPPGAEVRLPELIAQADAQMYRAKTQLPRKARPARHTREAWSSGS